MSVADPGFPRRGRGANPKRGGGTNLSFWLIIPENCMEIKKIGRKGERAARTWRTPWTRQ